MKKRVKITILILILGIVYTTYSYAKPRNEIEQKRKTIYIMDLKDYSVKEVITTYGTPDEIKWAEDSQHFSVVEETIDGMGITNRQNLRVFRADTLKEIQIAADLNSKSTYKSVDWIDNENMWVYIGDEGMKRYFIYNIENGDSEQISHYKSGEYLGTISARDDRYYNRYIMAHSENFQRSMKNKYGIAYDEGALSLDGTRLLYCNENKVSHMFDLQSGHDRYLFSGICLRWSPGETKIAYVIPKGKDMQDFNRDGYFPSTEMETWVYDMEMKLTIKAANFNAQVFFSPDDRYIIFYSENYIGQPYC